MNKPLKWSLLALGAAVILVIGAAVVVALSFDPNRYKGEIERIAKERTGRTLKLAGPIELAFYPSLGAKVAGVTLSERSSEREFLALDSAHASVALMPLWRGELIVDRIRVSGLRAQIVKDKDGRFNFEDLLGAAAGKPPAPRTDDKKPPGGEAVKFDVAGVNVERSAVSYRDLASGKELALSDLKLGTGRIAGQAEGKLELGAVVKGRNPDLDLKTELDSEYRLDLPAKAFALSKLDARVSGAVAGITGLKLAAKGDVAANPEKNEYRISGLSVDLKGVQGKDTLEGKLAAPQLVVSNEKAQGGAVTAEFRLKGGERSIEALLKLAGVEGSAKALLVPKLAADLSMTGPDLPMKSVKVAVTGSLRADLERQTANADLAAKFDESNIQAKVGLARFTPASYLFDINVDRLNLDKYFPPKKEPAKPAAGAPAKPAPEKDTPVDLSPLKDLNASGRLQFGALQARGLKLANLRAEVRAAKGRLDVAPHSANLYDGSVSGALTLLAEGNRVALKETLTNVSVGPLLRDFAQQDRLEGRGNVALDVSAAGSTVAAMKKALGGTARVNLRDGAIKGVDIGGILRKAKSALGGGQTTQAASATEKTEFSELSASFAIKNGVAHNEDLDVKAPLFRLGGRGDVDIGNSRLDYLAKAAVVASAKGQGGADLAQLAGVTVPVRLSGPFDDLKYQVDYGAVAAELAKSRVGEKVKERVGGKLEDRLKGLLGR